MKDKYMAACYHGTYRMQKKKKVNELQTML